MEKLQQYLIKALLNLAEFDYGKCSAHENVVSNKMLDMEDMFFSGFSHVHMFSIKILIYAFVKSAMHL